MENWNLQDIIHLSEEIQNVLSKMQWCLDYKKVIEKKIQTICQSDSFLNATKRIVSRDFKNEMGLTDTPVIVGQFRNLIKQLYYLIMYDEFFKVCEFVNVQYTERLTDAVNTFQSVSSGFTWIFTSKTMKPVITEKYELLKDFKQKGYVEKIIHFYGLLQKDTITDKDLFLFFDIKANEYFPFIEKAVDVDTVVKSNVITNCGLLVHKFRIFVDMAFDKTEYNRELDDFRSHLRNVIARETTEDVPVNVYEKFKDMPVSNLNNDSSHFRTGILEQNGFRTIADVYQASVEDLSGIYGVSKNAAYSMKEKVEQMAKLLSVDIKTKPLKLNYDNQTENTSEIVKIIYNCRRFQAAYRRIQKQTNPLDIDSIKKAVLLLNSCKTDGLYVFQSKSVKETIVVAYHYLKSLWNDERYKDFGWYMQFRLKNKNDVSIEKAWSDFCENSVSYYNCIEFLIPNAFGDNDLTYGLPTDLAEKIDHEVLYPDGLTCELRRYQVWGVKYILHQGRLLLGDEMGLGKTIQAIAAMVSLQNTGYRHFMVVCPASVVINWSKEVQQHSILIPYIGHGSKKNRNEAVLEWTKNGGVLITTYDTYPTLSIHNLDDIGLLTVDEAHYIKNPDATRSKRIRALCNHVERVLFLTGTPIENKVGEMLSLLSVLNKEVADDASQYASLATSQQFKTAIAPVYFRRKQKDVNKELPEKIEKIVWSRMNDAELRAYDASIFTCANPFMILRRVSWMLNDLSLSSKAQMLLNIVEQAVEDNRKVIVFSFFKDTIQKVKSLFGEHCTVPLDGSISSEQRQKIIDDFSKDKNKYVLASQIIAGGTGLNIQAASVVVLCEPQVKPSIENQAIGRAHRMGQSRNVLVYKLCCEQSIDEEMIEMLDVKKQQFDVFADRSVSGDASLDLSDADIKTIIAKEIIHIKKRNAVRHGNFSENS